MIIISDITGPVPDQIFQSAVAIGKFDGIHLGHQALLSDLKEAVRDSRVPLKSVVFTFEPSPEYFFSKGRVKCLMTAREKRAVFEKMGIDVLVEFPFNEETAKMEPQDFIRDILVGRLGAKCITGGEDLAFGRGGSGSMQLLREAADQFGFDVRCVGKVSYQGAPVSSTRIREAITRGELSEAARMLGRPFCFTGPVIHGRHLASKMHMPTMNQAVEDDKFLPPFGVYYSEAVICGRIMPAITNVGIKPTITDEQRPLAETYVYGLNEDVYGQEAVVRLLEFRRAEHKFSSVDELSRILQEDMEAGEQFHRNRMSSAVI